MISYITGFVDSIEDDQVIIDHNGMGYGIFMPTSALEVLGIGEEVKIYTYFNVREDAMQLFGFLAKEELKMFKMLIGVSGVGPKGGLAIISACPGDSLSLAIISGDSKAISKAQGIGSKTAQKIIIELKDKIDINEVIGMGNEESSADIQQPVKGVAMDAVEALVTLGYSKTSAFSAVRKIKNVESMDVEEVLKLALKSIL